MNANFFSTPVELLDVVSESTALFEQYEPLPPVKAAANDAAYDAPDYFSDLTWAVNDSRDAGAAGSSITSDFGLKVEPRFIAEYLGDRSQNALASVNIGGYGTQQTGETVSIYRSTARGTGLTGNSFRYVQSYFGKCINNC